MSVYVRTYVRACVYVRVRACVRACVHACMRACACACMRACVHKCTRVRACLPVCVCACVHVCVCACTCGYGCTRFGAACVKSPLIRPTHPRFSFCINRCCCVYAHLEQHRLYPLPSLHLNTPLSPAAAAAVTPVSIHSRHARTRSNTNTDTHSHGSSSKGKALCFQKSFSGPVVNPLRASGVVVGGGGTPDATCVGVTPIGCVGAWTQRTHG